VIVDSEIRLAEAHRELDEQWREHRWLDLEFKRRAKQRTMTQNGAMHLFFQWLAETLNDAGKDMRRTLRHDVDIPWTPESVKEHLWRPIQKAMTEKHSTTEITTVEPAAIHEVLSRHLGERLGLVCPPWPKRDQEAA
jgi:stalled ribosome rescue protein Dom34